ncbi:hypothetical protein VTI74DRAFT_4786 [Chaetomium olivicolor]
MPELYRLLLRMSLTDETPSALAARHALAALSYQHLGEQEAAIEHQTKSLRSLQVAVNRLGSGDVEITPALRAMAASMLLNIYETQHSDGSSLSWAVLFQGCKKIVDLVSNTPQATYEGDPALILDWIFYHETLYKFSIRHWLPKQDQQIRLAEREKIVSNKTVFSPMRQIINPETGCSPELLDLFCEIIDAVLDRDDPRRLGPAHRRNIRRLELRLDSLIQLPRVAAAVDEAGCQNAARDQQSAELYRLAAYVYLERMACGASREDAVVVALVDKALQVLREIRCLGPHEFGCMREVVFAPDVTLDIIFPPETISYSRNCQDSYRVRGSKMQLLTDKYAGSMNDIMKYPRYLHFEFGT